MGAVSQSLLLPDLPKPILAQTPPAACAEITVSLTPEEQIYAKAAWQYFVNNYQQATGFTNSTGGYPSGTLWDMGNYLMALNAARWLNLINQAEFDSRINKFLTSLSELKLFEGALPNKVYNAATGQIVDYGNNPLEKGIGWSALDIGRMLAAFHVIRTCHPQYADWLKGIVAKWQVARSVKDGQLYGATVTPDNKTLLVQEGRLGYEEYAARGYELWGFKLEKAIALEPFKLVEVNGIKIPVDTRDYQSTNANNYVVSESYILDGIEFGLEGALKDYAARVLEVQKRRFEQTGQITVVTEDNLDQAPYFIYNTVYANGVTWAAITEKNTPIPQFRNISTKAAFGWRYIYPDNPYAQQAFEAVKDLRSPDGGGFYAGLYEQSKQPNKALTGNTNGLILEILYYKARGNRPLIGGNLVTFAPTPGNEYSSVAPIPSVDRPQPSACPELAKPLNAVRRRYAQAAWMYFQANYQPKTGLVSDRYDVKAATLWGLGDYLAALHAARSLNIISHSEFDQRTRLLLGALTRLPLFSGQLPHRGYDIGTLQPVDYGGNPAPEGTGFSGLDVGRIMAALYTLKNCHPEYTNAVDKILLDWSFVPVVRNGIILSATVQKDDHKRNLTRINPETRLGYEEYAARTFQIWGFDVERAAVGGQYQTETIEGYKVPVRRNRPDVNPEVNQYTVSSPFLLYGLEMGFDPKMRTFVESMFKAESERYRRTGIFTASGTTLINRKPYIVNSTIIGKGEPWATLGPDNKTISDERTVSTATAFAYHALFPDSKYAQELFQASTDMYNPLLGFYEGFYEKTGKTTFGLTGSTNSIILQSLLYEATQRPIIQSDRAMNSPWWQAVSKGNGGQGLPETATQKARLVSDGTGIYWSSEPGKNNTPITQQSSKVGQ